MKRTYSTPAAIGLIIVIVALVNLLSASILRHARIDLTSEGLYTLTDGTQQILGKLKDNLRFNLYLTEEAAATIPGIKLYATRVRELLEEYEKASGGRVTLVRLDPKPDTEEEEMAEKYGIQRVPLQDGTPLYFGLVIVDESGGNETIPFFDPSRENFLEYDLSKAVVNISNPKKKVVGLLTGLPVAGDKLPEQFRGMMGRPQGSGDPWAVLSQLKQLYTVREIPDEAKSIDDDVDLLLLIHPKDLSAATKLAVDQYLLRGGRIVAFVDPYCEADTPPPNPQNPYESAFYDRSSKADDLLAAWGLEMNAEELAADLNIAANVRTASYEVRPFPIYLEFSEENLNREEIAAGGVDSLIFAGAGALRPKGDITKRSIVPVLQTSAEGSVIKKTPFMTPESVLKEFSPGKDPVTVAYRVSGRFSTAFPQGIESEGKKIMPALTESKEESSVIVFSDVDFITDRYSANVQNFFGKKIISLMNDNLNLAFNAVEVLSGSQDLISIRSRGKFKRPFTRVTEMQRAAQERWRAKETELQTKVQELETKLNALQSRRDDKFKGQVLTAEQMREIDNFKAERLGYQKQLRDVRKNLREDVERLHGTLKAVNIWLIPALIALTAVILHFMGGRRRSA